MYGRDGGGMDENLGNIDLVDRRIRADVPNRHGECIFGRAATPALVCHEQALQGYLKDSLAAEQPSNWRLGSDRYSRKFRFTMQAGVEADNMLPAAERDLQKVRVEMLALALPLHRQFLRSATATITT